MSTNYSMQSTIFSRMNMSNTTRENIHNEHYIPQSIARSKTHTIGSDEIPRHYSANCMDTSYNYSSSDGTYITVSSLDSS